MASEGVNGHEQQRVLFWVSLEEPRGGRDLPMGSKSRYQLVGSGGPLHWSRVNREACLSYPNLHINWELWP